LFRRTKHETAPSSVDQPVEPDPSVTGHKKGRPTPSRKEAEALNKARAKLAQSESSSKMREAMRTGDDRYLPARDKGPVKRFIRDFIDSKFSPIELLIPVMFIVLVLGWSGNKTLASYANLTLLAMLLLIVVDVFRMRLRLRKELTRRFPGESQKGTTYYAVARSLQMRFMRMPKTQVKIGQQLPDRYR
jgi:hypothetical protein